MKSLLATSQHFDSLYRRRKTGKIKEDDLFSLDDVFTSMRSSTSLFNGYGFSDDEIDLQGSINISNSLYFDDVSSDLSGREGKRTANKDKKQPNQPASSSPSGGALEGLFARNTAPAKTAKHIGTERSSIPSKSNEGTKSSALSFKSRSSPAISELRSTSQKSGGRYLSNTNRKTLSGRRNYVWKVDANKYETDTDDNEDLEFASDSKEVSPLRRNAAVIKKALFIVTGVEDKKISTAPLKSSSSKTRIADLSLSSHHGQEYSEKNQRSKRPVDSLSISRHCGRREESSILKSRSSSLSGPRQRRSSVRKELFDCSDMPVDREPKRCSSLKNLSSRRLSLEDAASTTKEQKRRSSSRPKRSKKKSVDQSNHSSTGDEEKSQRSASVSRKKKRSSPVKKKKNKDVLSHSSHHSQMSSASVIVSPEAPNQRNTKKSSSAILDKMSKSEHGKSRSSKSRTKKAPKKVDTSAPRSSKTMRSKSPLRSDASKARSEEFSVSNRSKLDSLGL